MPREAVPARAAKGGSSSFKLVVIVLFSTGLLGGYLFLETPHTHALHRSALQHDIQFGGGRKDIQSSSTQAGSTRATGAAGVVPSPSAPQVQNVERPPPLVAVTQNDQRHPQNVQQMIKGQSNQEEHKSALVDALRKQQSDKSEAAGKAGSSGAGTTAQAQTAGSKAAAGASAGAAPSTAVATTGSAPAGCKGAGKDCGLPGDTIHTLFTSNGSPYQNFQARIMVATWQLMRKMPGGEKHVAMTRILHRMTPDEVMDEIPTFRATPLQPECDKWCWFPVADRANAMQQWINAVEKDPSLQKAPWLLLLETDYVWVKPLQAPGNAYDPKVPGLAFAFDYISPFNPAVANILKQKCPTCDPKNVPASGPAPVLARFEDFKAATPLWEELSLYIETHKEVKDALGWVREMYAWDISVAANRLNILTEGPPKTTLISQPPHDFRLNNATMYHYTWGSIFKEKGDEIWKFDKRFYTDAKDALKVPMLQLPPPYKPGVNLHDGVVVTQELRDTLADMLDHMNKGIAILPDLSDRLGKA